MRTVLAVVVALVVAELLLLAVLWVVRPRGQDLKGALRLLPDVLRLTARLARDRTLPWDLRARLWLLLAYLALPFDLVPDVIPVLGYADDVIAIVWTLRSVVRRAGPE